MFYSGGGVTNVASLLFYIKGNHLRAAVRFISEIVIIPGTFFACRIKRTFGCPCVVRVFQLIKASAMLPY